jgi:exonuclease SbcC
LFKIREILDELKCPQVIMVSHEKELESFAHQVMRIEKKNGISQIKPI